jgi:hypothetical protein
VGACGCAASGDAVVCATSEYSERFWELMRNRMQMSFAKYGPVASAFPDKVNAMHSLLDRIRQYEATGNTEFMVDAANFAMIEFMRPSHKKAHFEATDSKASPGRRWRDKKQPTQQDNFAEVQG